MNRPRYKHHCDKCTFLGYFGKYDLYYCTRYSRHTFTIRWNNPDGHYRYHDGAFYLNLNDASAIDKKVHGVSISYMASLVEAE